MKRPFLIFIPALIGIVGLSHSKLAFSDELAQNLKTCLDGKYSALCDQTLLTPEQKLQVKQAETVRELDQQFLRKGFPTGEVNGNVHSFNINHQIIELGQGDYMNLTTGDYIMDVGGGDKMNLGTGEYIMHLGGGDYMNLTTGDYIMDLGGGDKMNLGTGEYAMHLGGGDYMNLATGDYIMDLGGGTKMNLGTGDFLMDIGGGSMNLSTGTISWGFE